MSFLGKEYPSHLFTCCSSPSSHSHLSSFAIACARLNTLCCNIEPINTCTHVCIVLYLVFAAVYYLFVYTLMHTGQHTSHIMTTTMRLQVRHTTSILKFSRSVVPLAFFCHAKKSPRTTDAEKHQNKHHHSTKYYSNREELIALSRSSLCKYSVG